MSLEAIFNPTSVAIVGASAKKGKAGYKFVEAVVNTGYAGKLFFVNPSGGEVFGRPIYKSIADIGDKIDVALVQVGREQIFSVLEQCAAAGAKAVILYTAGFGEADELGQQMEVQLEQLIKRTGMRVVGPNCQGIFSGKARLDLTGNGNIPTGRIGMISQSGGIGSQAWNEASKNLGIGFSLFVSFGNQTDIQAHEYLEYMGQDPDTDAIVLYVEGLKPGSGRKFFDTARSVSTRKPIIAIKGGQTESGQRAASSHTGSLAGAAAVFSAAMQEAGVIEVDNVEDLLGVAQALLACEPLKSNKLALVGFGGGHSTLATDAVEKAGFKVPPMSLATQERLRDILPYWAPRKNPIDLAGAYLADLRIWTKVIRSAMEEDGIGGILLFGSWAGFIPDLKTGDVDWEMITREVAALQREYKKPIIAFSPIGRGGIYQNNVLRACGVPMFDRVSTTVKAFKALHDRSDWLAQSKNSANPAPVKVEPETLKGAEDYGNLTEHEAYALLEQNGMPIAPYRLVRSAMDAGKAANDLGYPVVLKICSRDIIHKSDVGGVITGLQSVAGVEAAYNQMMERVRKVAGAARTQEVLVAKQVSGLEMIVGYLKDPHFGPTVMVGLGGIFVEVLQDVSIRLAPISSVQAREMIHQLKGAPLLRGSRGQKPLNVEALVQVLVRLSEIGSSLERVTEIDLNPVFVTPTDAMAADARIILEK